ncbi:hypothetical protein VNO80_11512 [Phaseolus coccineus]|uniref:Hexosyltransferase n=1 Tax=Phaseolus coccineus TaxID=3886 RepID=A0AAN9NGN2_PHACN
MLTMNGTTASSVSSITDYDKIIFIDADLIILRNIDFLFGMLEITATGNDGTLFNSGVKVVEPSNCTFKLLMDHINDRGCNWNADIFHEFASDVAHERWWKVHDAMPKLLQQFCMLKSKQKAQLEWDRRKVEIANYSDGHWRITVKDKRLKKCIDKLCSWKNMLKHWGETNWTYDESYYTPTQPAIATTSLSDL